MTTQTIPPTTALRGRLEDLRMITGRGRYVSDWNLDGQLYAHFLRSDRAHARIASIDVSAALAHPGVVAVLTGEDVAAAGLQSLVAAVGYKGRGGSELARAPRPALALGKVRFVGDAVAMVVADSALAAQDASELIAVDYEDLPVVVKALDALQPGAPVVQETIPGNMAFDYECGDDAGSKAAFAKAAKVVRITLDNNRVVANPMEPRACLGSYDAKKDSYLIHTCTQGVNGMRASLGAVLGVPPDRVDVRAEEVGGGFGVRFNIYPEYAAVLLAAKKLGRPVKWVGSRSEVFLADEQARDALSQGEAALDASGRILAIRMHYVINLGAYLAPTGPFINTAGIINCISGVYDVPATYARIRLAVTNTAPMAAYRGAGRPVLSYLLERLIDQVTVETGADPIEFRRKNMVPKNAFPYRMANGISYDCGDFAGVMDDAIKAADWAGFAARREASAKRGRLRGRGLSTYIEATGAGFAPSDHVEIRFGDKGEITLMAASHNHGQGHQTSFGQIVSGVLGVPMAGISIKTADPSVSIVGNATGGSRSLHGVGSVLQVAAKAVVEKGKALAADDLEAAEADIEFADGSYRIKGTDRSVTLTALAKKFEGQEPHPLNVHADAKFGATFPNGCHIAEVEIDPATGVAEIASYVACDDSGNIINHQIVEGQLHGGLTQGAGQVFGEHAVYDTDSGQLLTGSFMDYAMPRAVLVKNLTLIDHPVPTAANPLGAKGVGEAGVTGSLPALMSAVADALRGVGVTRFDMPATPNRLWLAIQAAKAGDPRAMAVADLPPAD